MTKLGDIPTTADMAAGNDIIPAGVIAGFPGPVPAGWAPCDGRTLDGTQVAYAALWGVVGTSYGGTGQSAFKTPGLMGSAANGSSPRIAFGRDPAGLAALDTLGKSGGGLDHVHAAGTLVAAAHSHSGVGLTGNHSHGDNITMPSHRHHLQHYPTAAVGAGDSALAASYDQRSGWGTPARPEQPMSGFTTPSTGGAVVTAAVGVSGTTGSDVKAGTGAGDRVITGNTGAANPPFRTLNYGIKL